MRTSPLIAYALLLAAGSAFAAPDRQAIEATVSAINGKAKLVSVRPTPFPQLNEVVAQDERGAPSVVYISDDGRYLVSGVLVDVQQRQNLTELATASLRRDLLASIPDDQKIIYATRGAPKHRVVVFTDISCGYCQRLHQHVQEFADKGIQVEYVAFPRGGVQSPAYAQMSQIWCAQDRKAALDDALAGRPVTAKACDSPVNAHYELGDSVGVQGTPAIYTQDGVNVGGYVTPDQLLTTLERMAAPSPAVAKN
jgi:thiol:disulfide interchange protein DsbC